MERVRLRDYETAACPEKLEGLGKFEYHRDVPRLFQVRFHLGKICK